MRRWTHNRLNVECGSDENDSEDSSGQLRVGWILVEEVATFRQMTFTFELFIEPYISEKVMNSPLVTAICSSMHGSAS